MSLAQLVSDAPPGQLEAVVSDIITLADGTHAVKQAVNREVDLYNNKNLRIVKVDGRSAVLSNANKRGNHTYYSQGSTFTIDPLTAKVSDVQASNKLSSEATSILSALKPYVEEHFPSDNAYDVFDEAISDDAAEGAPDDTKLTVAIVGQRVSSRNFLSGQWTAQYQVSRAFDKIEGKINVDVHYYEDGNVRLQTGLDVPSFAPESKTAAGVIKAIAATETEFEKSLNSTLVGLNENEFKALRRQLPVTRSQMVWGKAVNSYRLGHEIEKR